MVAVLVYLMLQFQLFVVIGSINMLTFSTIVDCGLEGILGVGGYVDVSLVFAKGD